MDHEVVDSRAIRATTYQFPQKLVFSWVFSNFFHVGSGPFEVPASTMAAPLRSKRLQRWCIRRRHWVDPRAVAASYPCWLMMIWLVWVLKLHFTQTHTQIDRYIYIDIYIWNDHHWTGWSALLNQAWKTWLCQALDSCLTLRSCVADAVVNTWKVAEFWWNIPIRAPESTFFFDLRW